MMVSSDGHGKMLLFLQGCIDIRLASDYLCCTCFRLPWTYTTYLFEVRVSVRLDWNVLVSFYLTCFFFFGSISFVGIWDFSIYLPLMLWQMLIYASWNMAFGMYVCVFAFERSKLVQIVSILKPQLDGVIFIGHYR